MKIRVLYIIDKLPFAGAQVHLWRLIRELRKGPFDVSVCCLMAGGPIADELRKIGVPVEVLGIGRIYGIRAARKFFGLAGWIRKSRIDIVHTYLVSANIYGGLAALAAHTPVLITSRRDTGFSRNWRLGLIEETLINPAADCVAVVSHAAAEAARKERGLSPEKIRTIYNGIDTDEWSSGQVDRAEIRRNLGIAGQARVITITANLTPVKGHRIFLEAVRAVVPRVQGIHCLVVGDGPLRDELKTYCHQAGLDSHVTFLGRRSDIRDILGASDLFVMTSYTEGMSNAMLEAMSMGLPVVASATGGNLEVIEPEISGILVPPGDAVLLAEQMTRVLTDPALWERLSTGARKRAVEQFSITKSVDETTQLYLDYHQRRVRSSKGAENQAKSSHA